MANRFWVGGTQSWNATAGTKWSTTDGGGSGAAVPTAADDVFFTALSGAVTVTFANSQSARSINCTGFTGTISHASAATMSIGDATAGASSVALKLVAGMTYTRGSATTSAWSFISTSATTQTVDFANKATGNITFNGAGSSYQLTGQVNHTSASFTFTQGTLDLNGQTIAASIFNSNNSNTRTLTMGAANISVASSGTSWNFSTITGLTITANTAVITLTGVGPTLAGGGTNYNGAGFSFTGGGQVNISSSNTFGSLSFIGTAAKTDSLAVSGATTTITGAFTVTGNSATNRVLVMSSIISSQRTISAGSVSLTNVDFQAIASGGAASPFTGTSVGDASGNTNVTATVAVSRFWVGGTGNWSDTAHWATSTGGATGASVPLPHDTVNFDANSFSAGSQVVTSDMPRLGKVINWTGATNTPAWDFSTLPNFIFGTTTLISGMSLTGTQLLTFNHRSTSFSVTSAGQTWPMAVTFNANSAVYTLADTFATSGVLTLTRSTLTANGSVTASNFSSSSANTRTINMGTGTWTLTGTGTVWDTSTSTSLTVNPSTSKIVLTDASASAKTFAGGGLTYNTLQYTTAGTGSLTITGANSFNTLSISGAARTVTFPASTTTTIVYDFLVNGTAGNLITINSSAGGTPATLSRALGTTSVDYLSIQDSTATGGAAWYAGANSTSVSGNTGWIFTAPPADSLSGQLSTMGVGS
jgi:hypothetical protein